MLQREKETMAKAATSCDTNISVTVTEPPINVGIVSTTQLVVTSPVSAAVLVPEVPGAIAVVEPATKLCTFSVEKMEDSGGRRPIRNRKLPAHLADPNYLSLEDATTAVKEATRRMSTTQEMIPPAEEITISQTEIKEEKQDETLYTTNDEYTDDDPNRLWCICKQPHNNRFMICCDRCEDWFHGKCVNVTKSQGKAMELKNIPWHCPDCKKTIATDKNVESQPQTVVPQKQGTKRKPILPETSLGTGRKSDDQLSPKSISAKTAKAAAAAAALKAEAEAAAFTALSAEPPSKIAAAAASKRGRRKSDKNEAEEFIATNCVICKKPARSGSVYCSDQCVQKYAQVVGSNSPTPDKSHAPASLTVSSPAIPLMEHTPATSTSTKSLMVATTSSKIKRSHSKSESAQDAIFNFHVINPGTSVSTEVVPQKPKEITASALFKAQKEKNVIVSGIVSAVTCPTTPQDVSSQPISLTPVPVVLPEKPEIIPNSVNVNAIMNSSSTDVKKKVDTSDGGSSKGRVMNTLAVVEKICIEEEVTLVSCIPDAKEKPERHITSLHSSDGKISRPSSSNTSTTTRRARTDSACKSKERERRDSQRDIKSDGPPSEKLHRENMRKSLKEILKNRIDGMSVGHKNKMEAMGNSADTVSIKIEDELVMCYGGANSTKCKNKYRSIYFNLKDEKNSLFREILLGSIEPYDLVRMTPEQMAPSELAQWRQQEKEKELEAIKRAELDKLAEAKKQELLDKGVEDAVQVAEESKPLDISDVIDEDAGGKRLSSGDKDLSARDGKDRSSSHHRNHEKKELRTRDGKDKGRDHKSDIEKSRGKDKHRHENERDREKGRKSDRHSSKSRHKSFGSSEKKTHHSKDGECRSKERNSSRDKDKERRSDRHKYRDKNQKPSKGVHKELPHRHQSGKSESLKITDSFGSENSKNEEPESLGQTFDLIVPVSSSSCYNYTTQLSTSESRTSTVTTAFEVSTTVSTTNALSTSQAGLGHKSQVTVTESKPIVKEEERHSIESEQELPSSTIKTPDFTDDSNSGVKREEEEHVFQSTLLMPELGEFKASFYNVSHSEVLKGLCFPESPVPIVGRIGPQTVWDYIDKMKKTKEIITFRLTPSSPADAKGYMSFFTYLSSRERLGVIGGISHPLKDVYLIPLGKHQPVPRCLLPFRGPGLPKERTHCLLAVVTRHAPNDGSLKRKLSTTEPVAKKKTKGEPTKVNRNKGNKNAAIVTSKSPKIPSPAKSEIVTDKGDENEPYTPWDEDEKTDVVEDSAAPSTSLASISAPESGSVVLSETQKQLQEIEAQIAKQKEDIVSILAGAKNVVGIPGLDGDYPESVSTENADTTGEIEEIPVFLRTAPALSNLDPRSSRSNIFKYQLPAVKFSANVTSTISIPGLDIETKEAPDDDDVVVLDQNEDFINTPLLKPVLEANDSKKVRDSAEEAYSPSAMDFSDDEPVGHGTAESVSQVDTYDGNKMITPNRCFNPVSSDSLELDKIKTHSDFDSKHPISQSKESQIVDLDERQTEEIKIILKKISTPRISTSHINEKQVGLERETSDGSPDLNDNSEPTPPGECHALPLRPLSASPLAKTIKAFDDSPFEKGPLFPCSQSKVKININLSTKTLPVPGGSYKKENNSSASFAFDSSKLKSDCSIEPRLYQDIDERILPKDGSILPPVPVQPESVALQSVEFPLVPPPVVMNQSLATLVPSVPLHVPPPPLQTSSSSSIGSVVINLNVPPPPFINVPPPAGVRFSSSQNLPQSSTASQSQQTVPRFLSRPPSSSPPRNQLCPIDTCSPSGRHSRTSPGPHSKLFHSMTSSHDEVDVVERVMTNKDKDGRSYLSRQDKERGIYGQERRRTHDKGVRVRRHRSRSNSRGRSRSRSRDSKRRRRHSRSRTPVRRSSRRNRSRSPTL
ncbi:unnamed protein product [Orchesella dallaii]|uniref:PHD finger protein 3 n=1 Tax=Orchesella dallaii TaxID=48710 RepID=A0ABP1QEE2_9HEXA